MSVSCAENSPSMKKDGWSAALYNRNASFVYSEAFTSTVMSLLDPKEGEKILDVGCGSGELTRELQHRVGEKGVVIGVDFSESMINKAKDNGVRAFVGDAQSLVFPSDLAPLQGKFDAVFSNAALHWCKRDPGGVLRSVRSSLKSGGRFACEMGGFMNCCGVRSALRNVLHARGYRADLLDPWYFPSVEEYQSLLEEHGFKVQNISLNPRITPLPGSMMEWLRTFCRTSWLGVLDDQEAEEIMEEVQRICEIDSFDGRRWSIMYVRLRFLAVAT